MEKSSPVHLVLTFGNAGPRAAETGFAESVYLLQQFPSPRTFSIVKAGSRPKFPPLCPNPQKFVREFGSTCACDPEGEAMSTGSQSWDYRSATPPIGPGEESWYAVQTRARHEKIVADRLREQSLTIFLPLVRELHCWSDRRKVVERPLFSCYVFVRTAPSSEQRLRVCRIEGVFRIVGVRGQGIPIPDEQVEAVRRLVAQQLPWTDHPFLKVGQRVRIRGGSLDGVKGVLLSRNQDRTLIISIDALQRSLAVRIEGYDVEPL